MNQLVDPLPKCLQESAIRIRNRVARTSYEIGRELAAAKGRCKHGQWLPFLKAAGISETTARRMMDYTKAIDADPSIDPGKALPPVYAVLGNGKSTKLADLENGKTANLEDLNPGEKLPELVELLLETGLDLIRRGQETADYRLYRDAVLLHFDQAQPMYDAYSTLCEYGRKPYFEVAESELAALYHALVDTVLACRDRTVELIERNRR